MRCPHRLHWACHGVLPSHVWGQEQALSRAHEWSCQSSANVLNPPVSSFTIYPDSIHSWLYIFQPSWLHPHPNAQPWHLSHLQNLQRLVLLSQQWKIPLAQKLGQTESEDDRQILLKWQQNDARRDNFSIVQVNISAGVNIVPYMSIISIDS